MPKVSFTLDGRPVTVEADDDQPLLYLLRDELGLNNPHFGCGLAQCGACTVHLTVNRCAAAWRWRRWSRAAA